MKDILLNRILSDNYYSILYGKYRSKKTTFLLWIAKEIIKKGDNVLFLLSKPSIECINDLAQINSTMRESFSQKVIDESFTIKNLNDLNPDIILPEKYDTILIDDVDFNELDSYIKIHDKLIQFVGNTPIILSVSTDKNDYDTATHFITEFMNHTTQRIWAKTQRVFHITYKHIPNNFIYSIYKMFSIKNFSVKVVYTLNGDFNTKYKFLNYKNNFE